VSYRRYRRVHHRGHRTYVRTHRGTRTIAHRQ
jgi:hypothetical protein